MRHRRNQSSEHRKQTLNVTLNMRVRFMGQMLVPVYSYVQETNDWTRWTYRSLSVRKARELEAAGKACPVTRKVESEVVIVGWKMLEPLRAERPSPTTLTMTTMKVASGEYSGGESGNRPTMAECDHLAKFLVWAQIGDTKAVAVRPRQSERDRRLAADLIGANGMQSQKDAEKLLRRGALAWAA